MHVCGSACDAIALVVGTVVLVWVVVEVVGVVVGVAVGLEVVGVVVSAVERVVVEG